MTPLDLRDAVDWMESRWGYNKGWSDWESLHVDFANFSVGSLKQALHEWYRRGERSGPNPSQLLKAVSETHLRRIERGVEEADRSCGGDHVFADPLPTDDERRRTCVLCGEDGGAVPCEHSHVSKTGRCAYCPAQVARPVKASS